MSRTHWTAASNERGDCRQLGGGSLVSGPSILHVTCPGDPALRSNTPPLCSHSVPQLGDGGTCAMAPFPITKQTPNKKNCLAIKINWRGRNESKKSKANITIVRILAPSISIFVRNLRGA